MSDNPAKNLMDELGWNTVETLSVSKLFLKALKFMKEGRRVDGLLVIYRAVRRWREKGEDERVREALDVALKEHYDIGFAALFAAQPARITYEDSWMQLREKLKNPAT